MIARADGLFRCQADEAILAGDFKDRPIDLDCRRNREKWDRGNFPAKSKGKKFDGSLVGFRHSEEKFCA
jgi:hypothetical protein